jgi:hypothetical protein
MQQKITRRALGLFAAGTVAAAAQNPPTEPPPLPANATEELTAARAAAHTAAEQIARVKLPMATEPAAHFKA